MKKWFILAMIVCVAAAVQAGEGQTKQEFVKEQMEWAQKDPSWNPTKAKLEAKFDKLDKNKDGRLSDDEKAAK